MAFNEQLALNNYKQFFKKKQYKCIHNKKSQINDLRFFIYYFIDYCLSGKLCFLEIKPKTNNRDESICIKQKMFVTLSVFII